MSLDFMGDSLSGDNHQSIGTRFGLKFDPMYYLLRLFGKDTAEKYAGFINKTGDKANEYMYKAAEPMFDLSRKYTPGREEGGGLDKVMTWVENKPASTTGLLIGGAAGGSGISGAMSGGASGGGGAAGGSAGGSASGPSSFIPSWQDMVSQGLQQGGKTLQDQAKAEEEEARRRLAQQQQQQQAQAAVYARSAPNAAIDLYAQLMADKSGRTGGLVI